MVAAAGWEREELFKVIERALECSPGDETEVAVSASDSYLTRFAANRIHQNVAERNAVLSVKVVMGQRVGRASANALTMQSVRETVAAAAGIARVARPNPEFRGLPGAKAVRSVPAWDEGTANCPAAKRAEAVKAIVDGAAAEGFEAAGAFSTAGYSLAVGNSHGVRAFHPYTLAELSCVVMSGGAGGVGGSGGAGAGAGARIGVAGAAGDRGGVGGSSSGYGAQADHALAEVSPSAVGAEAIDRCRRGRGAIAVEPGEYEVILEPYAVGTLLMYLAFLAFSARAYQEGRSALCGRLGERLVSDRVNLWDDGLDPAGLPMPFDWEGVPKRRVDLFEAGVAKAVVYDSLTAGKDERESTGHATPGGWGPMPQNLFMGTGDATVEDMIASTRRGLWITRFHYTNPVHPVKTVLTGMTRDGTFLVENGKVVGPVKNLRFTQSVLDALGTVELVGRRPALMAAGWTGALSAPALKLGRFAFTGVTEF